tara:strand:- start:7 stop:198 length:192 start_codon:yes stop_codon:yes gene_type:complete
MKDYHLKTRNKINTLYEFTYKRTVDVTDTECNADEIFAYITLQNKIADAYGQFVIDINEAESK